MRELEQAEALGAGGDRGAGTARRGPQRRARARRLLPDRGRGCARRARAHRRAAPPRPLAPPGPGAPPRRPPSPCAAGADLCRRARACGRVEDGGRAGAATRAAADEREHELAGLRTRLDQTRAALAEQATADEHRHGEELRRLHGELEQARGGAARRRTTVHEHERTLGELSELEQVRNVLASANMSAEEREHRQQAETDRLGAS